MAKKKNDRSESGKDANTGNSEGVDLLELGPDDGQELLPEPAPPLAVEHVRIHVEEERERTGRVEVGDLHPKRKSCSVSVKDYQVV